MLFENWFWFCIQPCVISPHYLSLGTYELNFVCTFIYHQLGKERHSMESSFVAFCDLQRHATDVTYAICSTDVQIHSVG